MCTSSNKQTGLTVSRAVQACNCADACRAVHETSMLTVLVLLVLVVAAVLGVMILL
jgi:hypothetical protein